MEKTDLPLEKIIEENKDEWLEIVSAEIQLGMVLEGLVKTIIPAGLFVNLEGGFTGFIHISNVNPFWHIRDLHNVVSVGQTIRAKVIDFDAGREQIKLQALPPEEGQQFEGVVTKIMDFGAFVDLGLSYSGLLHKKNMGRGYVRNVTDVVKIGDTINVEVVEAYEENKKFKIGLKLI